MTYVSRSPLIEAWHPGGFMVSQANGKRYIDRGLISGGAKVYPGMVLGQQTTGAAAVAAPLGANTGNGTFGAIVPVAVPTQIGVYSVAFTSATAFTVTSPNGQTAPGVVGTAFAALGIGFTITAGGTAFVAGDSFTVTTSNAVGKPAITSAAGTNTGNGTIGTLTANGYAPAVGVYTVEFDDATHFVVASPNGQEIGHGVAGTAFSSGGLTFTITAGGTAFVPGDSFTITVAANANAKWLPCTSTAVDGTQVAAGICFGLSDASLNDVKGAIVTRDCEVNLSELVWDSSMNAAAQAAAIVLLASHGIIGR